ncbi:MAG: hypothetical protein M4579_004670 [Chaenotheca gracillima]|nr:MAG: hypothetical protein M4579_004670 [Chaenotheca gracillima]
MAYNRGAHQQRPPQPYQDPRPYQRAPPQQQHQGYQEYQPDGYAEDPPYGGGGAYGQNAGMNGNWDQGYDSGYSGGQQGHQRPPADSRRKPEYANGHADQYGPQQGQRRQQPAPDQRAQRWQEPTPQQGAARPNKNAYLPAPQQAYNGRHSEDIPRNGYDEQLQPGGYDGRAARSFDDGHRDQNGGPHPNQYGAPDPGGRRLPKSSTSPNMKGWDNPFPSFPHAKKSSRQEDPHTLDESMKNMQVDPRQDGSAAYMQNGGDRHSPNRHVPTQSDQSQYSQNSHGRGPSIDNGYPPQNGYHAAEPYYPEQNAVAPRQRPPMQNSSRSYDRQNPTQTSRNKPSRNDRFQEAHTAPASPMKTSFEAQRSMTMPNQTGNPNASDAHKQYPGQRQYKPLPAEAMGGFNFQQDSQGGYSQDPREQRERYGDARTGGQHSPNKKGPSGHPKPSRQESIGDFYDSYYDAPNAADGQHGDPYGEDPTGGIDMPNFDAIPPPKPFGHQRGMTIDQHLKAPKSKEAPPLPTHLPGQRPGNQKNNYQPSPAVLRSKSQPDLRGGGGRAQRGAPYEDPDAGFQMVGDTPGHFDITPNNGGGEAEQYRNGGQGGQNRNDPYRQYPGQKSSGSRGPHDRRGQDPNVHQKGARQGPPKAQRGPPGPNGRPMPQATPGPARMPSGGDARRANSLGNQQNPDALPAHPPPVRPGLLPDSPASQIKPPPNRQYNNSAPPDRAAVAPPPASAPENRKSNPVTHDELARLQQTIRMNPADLPTQLLLVKKWVEAATYLVDEGGRADQKTKNKNREKFILDAHKLLKKLVGAGYTEAIFYLADCHGMGRLGLENDPKEAFVLYQSAAKGGHAEAAYRTAVCCEIGQDGGTRKDPLKAMQWYKRAATLGNVQAMYKMGMITLKGLLGQPANSREAVSWLKRAAEKADADNPHALHELALLYGNAAPNDPIVRDEAYAKQLFFQAADLGYKASQFRLGCAFEYGLMGCPIDPRQSIAWYSRAAVQEEHQSELALSGWYLTGSEGVLQQSDTEAYLWARKAAQAGLAKAEFAMGYFTEVGIGAPANLEDAKRWYWRASAQNFSKATERLEDLRRGGSKVQKSRERLSRSNVHRNEGECTVM